jgi:glutaredoxin 3
MIHLYTGDYCPYCHKVIDFLNENKIDFVNKDISVEENRDFVVSGGKMQIPYMHDTETGTQFYESADIIEYIKNKYILK